jgi:hypothetical protein
VPLPPLTAASIPVTLALDPANETKKNGRKNAAPITPQAATMTITANTPILPPAAGLFFAAAFFTGARFFAGFVFFAEGVVFLLAVDVFFFGGVVVVVFFAIYNSKWCLAPLANGSSYRNAPLYVNRQAGYLPLSKLPSKK